VSAISVNQNTVTLNVLATEPGKSARVWFDPPGIVQLSGQVETKAPGAGSAVDWKVSAATPGVRSVLGGHVSAGQPRVRFVRRVADPRALPGLVLVSLLEELGVKVTGKVQLGRRPGGERLAYLSSAPMSQLIYQLGKLSDNFYAETIFKTLGGEASGTAASSAAGAKRVEAWLAALGLEQPQNKIVNGSGLFEGNRLTPRTLTNVLSKVYFDPRLGPDFVAHLAVGGSDGTLRSRFRSATTRGRVRAKTGTLRSVDALGGFVLSSSGRLPIVFVVLINGIADQHLEVRRQIDRAVSILAKGS
jgi:D-alanyl-D-alanine carboxypeptidase/D-alanyl-D-alanine-endopeptidase (penicillin-binding protein 4)